MFEDVCMFMLLLDAETDGRSSGIGLTVLSMFSKQDVNNFYRHDLADSRSTFYIYVA